MASTCPVHAQAKSLIEPTICNRSIITKAGTFGNLARRLIRENAFGEEVPTMSHCRQDQSLHLDRFSQFDETLGPHIAEANIVLSFSQL